MIYAARMVVHAWNLSTWEAEAGGLQVSGQPGQLSKTPSQKKNQGGKRWLMQLKLNLH
jgi:hypothetical protein